MIVKDRKIFLVQIADKFAVPVGGDEEHVHFIDARADGEHRAGLRIVRCRIRSGRASIRGGIGGARWRKKWQYGIGLGETRAGKRQVRLSAPESDRRMPCTSCLRSPKFSLQPTSKCTSYSLDARRMPNDGRAVPQLIH